MGHVLHNNLLDEREFFSQVDLVFKDFRMNGGVGEIVIRIKFPIMLCFVYLYGHAFKHDIHVCTFIKFSTHKKRCMVHKVCFMLIFP